MISGSWQRHKAEGKGLTVTFDALCERRGQQERARPKGAPQGTHQVPPMAETGIPAPEVFHNLQEEGRRHPRKTGGGGNNFSETTQICRWDAISHTRWKFIQISTNFIPKFFQQHFTYTWENIKKKCMRTIMDHNKSFWKEKSQTSKSQAPPKFEKNPSFGVTLNLIHPWAKLTKP